MLYIKKNMFLQWIFKYFHFCIKCIKWLSSSLLIDRPCGNRILTINKDNVCLIIEPPRFHLSNSSWEIAFCYFQFQFSNFLYQWNFHISNLFLFLRLSKIFLVACVLTYLFPGNTQKAIIVTISLEFFFCFFC